ncbi:CLK4-associating serine/arginine rich protein isoform X2 [Leguminivora glycinivorella]|uniref:CLK4-associating serine/arginine rich protein isoform X2 n=1 Tax=Leguminivora glycinivorella TaxID=1035111 RepID=UPI00200F159B|nr:CLK4-associating serine/arginine rich protein isoform X2 [Leguminivora glycinivorella]
MWHEARKQEKMIRGMIVDYRRRAERRKDFYEKIKAEPTQFLQLHGRPCKIHLDPAIAAAGEGPAIMMPWQGDTSNMIDRFDVRAHLDYIPEVKNPYVAPEDLSQEERQCNYESYRILAQNAFLGISEEKFLQQLAIEEQFGVTIEEKEMQKERLNEKKGTGAAIGYNYNDPGAQPSCSNPTGPDVKKTEQEDSDDDSDLEIIDVDLSIDVNKMEASQAHELNSVGPLFGMAGCDLFSFLTGDADDAEHQKQLLREEKEKAMFSGRKSRKERRAHRDKKLQHRVVSPPAYAAPRTNSETARSVSRSASRSPEPAPQIEFITSFGQDDDEVKPPPPIKPLYADKLKKNLKPEVLYSDVARKPPARSPPQYNDYQGPRPFMGPHRPRSRSRSRSRSYSRSVSRSRSKSRSRSRSRYSSSRSRSYSPQRRSRSASRPRQYRNRRSRSPPNYGKRNRSRSISYESNDKGATKAAMPRYYGRRKEDKSSSELSLDSDSSDTPDDGKRTSAVKSNTNQNQLRLTGSSSKGSSRQTNSLKEKLKKKMQAQLSRQLRADKRAEAERLERESRRQARRDEEMRELAIKLRRKQREMRHQQNRRSSDDDSDASHSGSSRDSPTREKKKDEGSRSRSPSPTPKKIPVWETNRDAPRVPPPEHRHRHDHPPDTFHRPPPPYPPPRPPRSYDHRHDNTYDHQQTRWDQNYAGARRRPYGYRGGYRGHGPREHEHEYEPPDWRTRPPPPPLPVDDDGDGDASGGYRNKVKLVDY